MKFPKLKHTVLCQLLLYLPAFSLFLFLWLMRRVIEHLPGLLIIILVIAVGLFGIWYLLAHFLILMLSDALFAQIRSWKRDRLVYRTGRNGSTREKAFAVIERRCGLWGRSAPTQDSAIRLYYRHGISWTYFWSAIEKRVAICQVEHLDAALYRQMVGRARRELGRIPDGKPRFKSKREAKAPRAYAFGVVILAGRVDDDVPALVRMKERSDDKQCLIPCVACPEAGTYIVNANREYFEAGMTPRPARNYACAMLQRLVFGGFLPREDRTTQPEYDLRFPPEMSLWAYLGAFRAEMRGADAGEEKEREKMFSRLREGEVRKGEYAVYCKLNGRIAECAYLPDEADERLLTLIPDDHWYFTKMKKSIIFPWSFGLNTRKMKPNDLERVRKHIEAALIADGWRIDRQ